MPSMHKWLRKRLVFLRMVLLRDNVALASYPRSGNTWLSKLLEALSGRQAGSIYRDLVFPRPATGIVIKTHKLDGQRYNRILHLMRNPFDSISSHYDYMHHYFPSNEKARSWEAHVEVESREWRKHTEYWMHQDKPLITVLYENLMSQPNQELRRLADFLNLDVSDKEIEEAIESCKIDRLREASSKRGEDAASFFREGGSGRGMSRYSADEIKFVESELGDLMTHFGYKTPPQPR
jgi:hypothetical protein